MIEHTVLAMDKETKIWEPCVTTTSGPEADSIADTLTAMGHSVYIRSSFVDTAKEPK